MRLLLSFFVFFSLYLQQVNAAETVFESSENKSFTVNFSGNDEGTAVVNNFFIRELARYNLTSLYHTSYTFHYTLHRSIHKTEPYVYRIYTSFDATGCTGDIWYRNFDISDILQPELVDFMVVVDHEGNYIFNKSFSGVKMDDDGVFNIDFDFETFIDDNNLAVKIEDVAFYSGEQDRDRFSERIASIDNYYAALAALDKSLDKLELFRVNEEGPILTYIRISESERIFNRISSSDFIKSLSLTPENKPDFFAKLDQLDNELDALKYFYARTLKSKQFIRLTTPVSEIVKTYVDEVSDFYYLSQDATHTYQSYFFNLSKFSYNSADLNQYRKGLTQILKKTGYCNDTDAIAGEIKIKIYNAYLEKAGDLIDDQYFYMARGLLKNASQFYTISTGMVMPVSFNILMGKVTYAIYNSYLHLIDRAIEMGNFELAENYIEKARDFQSEHSTTIISSKYIHTVSEKLVNLYITKGINQNQNEEFTDALYCFEQAHDVCNNLGVYNQDYIIKHGLQVARNGQYRQLLNTAEQKLEEGDEPAAYACIGKANIMAGMYDIQKDSTANFDQIQSKYYQQIYLNDISSGKKYLQAGNYTMAYFKLLDALELEDRYSLDIYDPLPEIFAQAATPYLIDQCKLGEVKVNKNKLDEARQLYENCIALQTDYGLNFEPQLSTNLTMLNNNIFSRQCLMVATQYEEKVQEANHKVESGDFISALSVLKATEAMLKKNYFCEYDQSSVVHMLTMYAPAAEYQTLAEDAQEALSSGYSDRFIEIYDRMEELSERFEVIRQRIEPMPLHYLFSVKTNLALLESSITKYESSKEYETALKILNVLEANNTSVRDSRNIQQAVAQKLARADKATAMNTDPKEDLEKYTGGSAWFRYFRKTYLKNRQE